MNGATELQTDVTLLELVCDGTSVGDRPDESVELGHDDWRDAGSPPLPVR